MAHHATHIPTQSRALARLARFVLRHKRAVVGFWLVLLVAGIAGAGRVGNRLSTDFALPGEPGYETATRIDRIYGNGASGPPSVLVVTTPPGKTVASAQDEIAAAFETVREQTPSVRVVDHASTGDDVFVTDDGRTTYALLFGPGGTGFGGPDVSKEARAVVRHALPPGFDVQATGLVELASGSSPDGPGILAETVLAALGALAVLAFVFASFLALVPLLVAAFAILTTLLVLLGLTYLGDISVIVEFLVALVGLGVAIDYSLLLVTRWREERARGLENGEAVVAAMTTAGRAVLLSGLSVGIGLVALVVLPEPALRSVGIGGVLIPLASVAVSLTLLPAILGGIGPRVDWPRLRRESRASRGWTAWARLVVGRKWLAAALGTAILALLVVPVFGLTTGETSPSALASSGPAHDAYQRLLAGGVPSGVLTPVEVLADAGAAPDVRDRLGAVPGMEAAVASSAADSNREGTTVLVGVPHDATVNSSSLETVRLAREAVNSEPGAIGLAGEGAIELDYQHAIFGTFPLLFSLVAVLTFLLLTRAFRSVVLAAKALLLNLVSLAATFGAMTWFWQEGHGSETLFGVPATGAISFWLPLMVFAFLFGLSMDYEVFILTRVREEYERCGSTAEAVVNGLGRTGRLVTSAALILFLAFASLSSAPDTDLKVFATALGAGILLDATVVRALLLPALVALFGRWNWWLPQPLARALRVPAAAITPSRRSTPDAAHS
ncbi:MAG: MMPL family transporter [Actinomycetota bacterium]|nr:MMPL family transporter [Actinomycetota bacterium]